MITKYHISTTRGKVEYLLNRLLNELKTLILVTSESQPTTEIPCATFRGVVTTPALTTLIKVMLKKRPTVLRIISTVTLDSSPPLRKRDTVVTLLKRPLFSLYAPENIGLPDPAVSKINETSILHSFKGLVVKAISTRRVRLNFG
ncbi:hypothetical protein Zmor_003882 [Zophobas morio]|jgi:hypothetical protein|uniref:Uncharacterized protein n=1 Tax=Zophobas morio TaxID=2755281 RepID=A0AA38HK85_9CUCU|nr:hypothetical protein Zmor_003882 [Zophobas morio]